METENSLSYSQESHTHPYSMPYEFSKHPINYVGYEDITAVVTGSPIFRNVTLCSPLKVNLLHVGFFPGLFSDPEDGGEMSLRNVGRLSTDYIPEDRTLHPIYCVLKCDVL
jgi:hypothetical protein